MTLELIKFNHFLYNTLLKIEDFNIKLQILNSCELNDKSILEPFSGEGTITPILYYVCKKVNSCDINSKYKENNIFKNNELFKVADYYKDDSLFKNIDTIFVCRAFDVIFGPFNYKKCIDRAFSFVDEMYIYFASYGELDYQICPPIWFKLIGNQMNVFKFENNNYNIKKINDKFYKISKKNLTN